uniref:Uncharacterized protein n=1 Tax=viral metagenome TaxID=1070528 RepID=A0A6M3KJE0_9ZZZZ
MIARALKVYSVEEVKEAIDAFVADPWPERKRFLDPVYCFGKQRGKADNLERWISASKMEQKKKVRYE